MLLRFSIPALLLLAWIFPTSIFAQGPPILTDKPIMTGGVKVSTHPMLMWADYGHHKVQITNVTVMLNLVKNIEIAPEIALNGNKLGDAALQLKYQFYRKDEVGKSLRISAKAKQSFPTGENLGIEMAGFGAHRTYFGTLVGYESLKYGIIAEAGYTAVGNNMPSEFNAKLAIGLPLLPQKYPPKQLNLFTEYEVMFIEDGSKVLYVAPGLQYSRRKWAAEASFQAPMLQSGNLHHFRKKMAILAFRYAF